MSLQDTPANAGPETTPQLLLSASLKRWAQLEPDDKDPDVAAQLRHVEVFALAAIADELHALRRLLWYANRRPGEGPPAELFDREAADDGE